MLVVAGVVAVAGYDWTTSAVVLLVGAAKVMESLSDVVAGLLQRHERLDQVAIGLIMRGAASVTALSLTFWRTRSVVMAVASLAITWTIVVVVYDFNRAHRVLERGERLFRFDWNQTRRLVVLSLPLGVVMTLISLNINIPRYILERKLGAAELGIFASLAYLLTAANFVVSSLGQAASVRLARSFATGDLAGFSRVLRQLVFLGALIVVIGVPLIALIGKPLVALLYAPEYADHLKLLLIVVAATGFYTIGSFLGFGLTSARSFLPQLPVVAVTTATTAVFSFALVPVCGISGAAWAMLISAVLRVFGFTIALKAVSRVRRTQ